MIMDKDDSQDETPEYQPRKGNTKLYKDTREYTKSEEIYRQALQPLTESQKNEHKYKKWVRPEVMHKGTRYPKVPKRDDGYGAMTDVQKIHFIAQVKAGCGIDLACDKCGIAYAVFQRAFAADPEFRDQINHSSKIADQTLDSDILNKANENKDLADLIATRKLRLDVESRRYARRNAKKLVDIKEREVNAKVKAVEHVLETTAINFKNLDMDELERYTVLFEKMKPSSTEEMTAEEALEYVGLTKKLSAPVADHGEAIKALGQVENLFSNDEDG